MISLKPANLNRYAAIARLFLKYGHGDLLHQVGLESAVAHGQPEQGSDGAAGPESLADDLEQLGPTFIKLGQLLSTRPDFLPPPYLSALERLQDNVEPLPYAFVEQTIESELGVRISKAFAELDPTPIAAASIGQVHRAKLRDGRRVAVKVQRPAILARIQIDLAAMHDLGAALDRHTAIGRRVRFVQLVESLRDAIIPELDYRQEAENCRTLRNNLSDFDLFVIPKVIEDYSSEKVITLEYIEGAKITDLSQVVLVELDRRMLADRLFQIYLHQVLVDGVFHADPHPGNLMLTPDHKIALMDFGMVSRVNPETQLRLLKLLMALSDGRADEMAREAIAIGRPFKEGHFQEMEFRERVSRLVAGSQGKPVEQLQTGQIITGLNGLAGETGLKLPNSILMLGKTLLNLDKVVIALDPTFDPNAALKRHTTAIFARHSKGHLSLSRLYQSLLESTEFLERLPERLNKFSELAATNKLRIAVDTIDERRLMAGLQKIANRITSGLILAAMIVGASLMMNLKLTPTIFGYPVLAMIFFLVAAVSSLILLWQIAFRDESPDE